MFRIYLLHNHQFQPLPHISVNFQAFTLAHQHKLPSKLQLQTTLTLPVHSHQSSSPTPLTPSHGHTLLLGQPKLTKEQHSLLTQSINNGSLQDGTQPQPKLVSLTIFAHHPKALLTPLFTSSTSPCPQLICKHSLLVEILLKPSQSAPRFLQACTTASQELSQQLLILMVGSATIAVVSDQILTQLLVFLPLQWVTP